MFNVSNFKNALSKKFKTRDGTFFHIRNVLNKFDKEVFLITLRKRDFDVRPCRNDGKSKSDL